MSDREAFESIYKAAPEHRQLLLIWQQQLEAWDRALAYERSRFEEIPCPARTGRTSQSDGHYECELCLGTGKLYRKVKP